MAQPTHTTNNHQTDVYHLTDESRLWISSWETETSQGTKFHTAHSVQRLVEGRWVYDNAVSFEAFTYKAYEADYRPTDLAYNLIVSELGTMPPRFFRDHHLDLTHVRMWDKIQGTA